MSSKSTNNKSEAKQLFEDDSETQDGNNAVAYGDEDEPDNLMVINNLEDGSDAILPGGVVVKHSKTPAESERIVALAKVKNSKESAEDGDADEEGSDTPVGPTQKAEASEKSEDEDDSASLISSRAVAAAKRKRVDSGEESGEQKETTSKRNEKLAEARTERGKKITRNSQENEASGSAETRPPPSKRAKVSGARSSKRDESSSSSTGAKRPMAKKAHRPAVAKSDSSESKMDVDPPQRGRKPSKGNTLSNSSDHSRSPSPIQKKNNDKREEVGRATKAKASGAKSAKASVHSEEEYDEKVEDARPKKKQSHHVCKTSPCSCLLDDARKASSAPKKHVESDERSRSGSRSPTSKSIQTKLDAFKTESAEKKQREQPKKKEKQKSESSESSEHRPRPAKSTAPRRKEVREEEEEEEEERPKKKQQQQSPKKKFPSPSHSKRSDESDSSDHKEKKHEASGEDSSASSRKDPYEPTAYLTVGNEKGGSPNRQHVEIEAFAPVLDVLRNTAQPVERLLKALVKANSKKSGDSLVGFNVVFADFKDEVDEILEQYLPVVLPEGAKTRKLTQKKADAGISALCNSYHQKSDVAVLQASTKAFVKTAGQLFREVEGFAFYSSPDRSYSMLGSERAMDLFSKPTIELVNLIRKSQSPITRKLKGDPSTWGHGMILMAAMQIIAEKEMREKYDSAQDALTVTDLPAMTCRDIRIAYEHLSKHHHFDHCNEASLVLKHLVARFEKLCVAEIELRKEVNKKGGGRAKKTKAASRRDEDDDEE